MGEWGHRAARWAQLGIKIVMGISFDVMSTRLSLFNPWSPEILLIRFAQTVLTRSSLRPQWSPHASTNLFRLLPIICGAYLDDDVP